MKRLFLLLGMLASAALAINEQAPLLPDPVKTPGDVLTSDPNVICRPGYTKTVRDVPQQVKEAVYREYGITSRANGEYEVDHLVSLELGGSNSIRNLWPESYKTQPLNAHVKDQIENKLHDLACAGKITFPQAQQAIAHNWEAAYVKYLGPLPGGAEVQNHPNQPEVPVTHVPTLPKGAEMPTLNLPGNMPEQSGETPADTLSPIPASAGTPGPPNANGSCPDTAPVIVSRAGIYHLPQNDPNYGGTHAVACFVTAEDAQAAGYRAPK